MDELKEIDMKNHGHYYPDDIINIKDRDLDKILVCEKLYQNHFIYSFARKIPHDEKPDG